MLSNVQTFKHSNPEPSFMTRSLNCVIMTEKGVAMAEIKLNIEGMSCRHCVMAVKKALGGLSGVASSEVEIGSAIVKYDESKTTENDLREAVEKAGFSVK